MVDVQIANGYTYTATLPLIFLMLARDGGMSLYTLRMTRRHQDTKSSIEGDLLPSARNDTASQPGRRSERCTRLDVAGIYLF